MKTKATNKAHKFYNKTFNDNNCYYDKETDTLYIRYNTVYYKEKALSEVCQSANNSRYDTNKL